LQLNACFKIKRNYLKLERGDIGATSALTLEGVLVHNLDLGEIKPNLNLNLNKLKTENLLWRKEVK
jgi:hypothetical protein